MPPTSLIRKTLPFVDERPPAQIHALLERATDAVFEPIAGDAASRRACFDLVGVRYRLTLRYVSATTVAHRYEVDVHAEPSAGCESVDPAAQRRRAESWIAFWMDGLGTLPAEAAGPGLAQRHREQIEAWRRSDAALDDVEATQREILAALRNGDRFVTSHKEGGTTLRFDGRHFVRDDFGEAPGSRRFDSDAEFLSALQQFYDFETSRHTWPSRVPLAHAWRLILRRLQVRSKTRPSRHELATGHGRPTVIALVVGCVLAAGVAWWRVHPKAEALTERPAGAPAVTVEPLGVGGPDRPDWQGLQARHRRSIEDALASARAASR